MSEKRELFFGKCVIDERQVFYESENIIGIVNISPILPDHVLVIPKSYEKFGAPQKFYDMTSLFNKIILTKKKTISFPLEEYWKDIGRLNDYEKANKEFLNKF